MKNFSSFLIKEWLFILSLTLFIISSLYLKRFPYYSTDEMEVLYILYMLFIVIKGFERSGFLKALSLRLESGKFLSLKLIFGTFLIAAFITNDVALIVMVPITLMMDIKQKDLLIILESIAANAAALFPFSNPQNLYIYWHYNLNLTEFIKTISPFCTFFLIVLLFLAFFIKSPKQTPIVKKLHLNRKIKNYIALFVLMILTVTKILPLYVASLVFFYAIYADFRSLKVDYFLLATFFLFFGISDNFQEIFKSELSHPHSVFISSIILSQIISNVPAILVMANFTQDWKTLLWGVNVGGFGILWGSLANLISYKLYTAKYKNSFDFLGKFLFANILALILGVLLFYGIYYYFLTP